MLNSDMWLRSFPSQETAWSTLEKVATDINTVMNNKYCKHFNNQGRKIAAGNRVGMINTDVFFFHYTMQSNWLILIFSFFAKSPQRLQKIPPMHDRLIWKLWLTLAWINSRTSSQQQHPGIFLCKASIICPHFNLYYETWELISHGKIQNNDPGKRLG